MYGQIFSVIAPVFICASIGWLWKKQNRPFDTQLVAALSVNIGTPCLAFSTLLDTKIEPEAFLKMGGACVLTVGVFAVVYYLFLKAAGLNLRAFLPSLTFSNVGNMGLPLCLLAFGQEGLALAIAYFAINVILFFSAGVAVAAGATSPGQILKLPVLYAVGAAMVFMFTGLTPPAWVSNTVRILGGLTIPLMLITLGVSLAGLGIKSLPRSLMISLMRLVPGFLVGWGAAELLGFEGVARGVLIIQCAMPIAVFNYLFAVQYGNEPEEVAGTVVLSTVLSFATLPALLAFVM